MVGARSTRPRRPTSVGGAAGQFFDLPGSGNTQQQMGRLGDMPLSVRHEHFRNSTVVPENVCAQQERIAVLSEGSQYRLRNRRPELPAASVPRNLEYEQLDSVPLAVLVHPPHQQPRELTRISEECLVRLREHFTEAEVVELTFIIGYQTFASKFAKAMRLEPQGFSS